MLVKTKQCENVAIISSNITLVVNYFIKCLLYSHTISYNDTTCFILPQRQGSIENKQGIYEKYRSLLMANQFSVFA